jgi:hypothetical protein
MPGMRRHHPRLRPPRRAAPGVTTILAALTTAAAVACAAPATAPAVRPVATETSPALQALEITVEPAARALDVGEAMPVRVRVVNRSPTPLTVVGSGSCTVLLDVYDAAGAPVEPTRSRACTRDCRALTFLPGQLHALDTRLTTRTWSNADQRFQTLTPGTYRLVGHVAGSLGECGGPAVRAASAPATVQLR